MMTDALMPESSSPLVSVAQAVLDRGKLCATVSQFLSLVLTQQNNIIDGFDEGFGLFVLFCVSFSHINVIFLILDLMLHHKIYKDHKSYKPLEGQKRPALMNIEYGAGVRESVAFPYLLVFFISLFIVFMDSRHKFFKSVLCLTE